MEQKDIRVQSNIDPKNFRRFALFDTFCRRKRWRGPLLFAAILSAFAAVCFAMQGRKEQAEFPWSGLFRAYRTGNGVYLYADPGKAFLLPGAQVTEAVWARIRQCVPADRLYDLRKSNGISGRPKTL